MKVKKKSQKQEKDIANKIKGKVVVASGALWGAKGDVRTSKYLIEAKTTGKSYYSLTADVWEKIEGEAVSDNLRVPLMMIDLNNGEKRYVVFSTNDFTPNMCRCVYDNRGSNKSYRLNMNSAGCDSMGGYTFGTVFVICGKYENELCCMLYKDFMKEYAEELDTWE